MKMKEININIEGYNVNGICVGCLNYNRKMYYHKNIKECFKTLANIDIPDGLTIQVCWECVAYIRNMMKFKQQILDSFDILISYSQKHPFLNSPNDISDKAVERLKVYNNTKEEVIKEEEKTEIKEEIEREEKFIELVPRVCDPDAGLQDILQDIPQIDVKTEDENEILEDSIDYYEELPQNESLSEDDVVLSSLKTEKVKKKKKKEKEKKKKTKKEAEQKKERKSRRLHNLPEKVVELYTMSEEEMWRVRERDVNSDDFKRIKYKCELCLSSFNTKKLKDLHDIGKHYVKTEDIYQCDVCKSNFLSKETVKVHRKIHLAAYKCRECSLVTTLKSAMGQHECAKKVFEPGYPCPECPDKRFSFESSSPSMALEYGGMYFRRFDSLSGSEVQCWECCPIKVTTRSKLSYHKSIKHQEKPQCDCCGKIFANKMTLKYHLKLLPENKDNKPKELLFLPCKGCNKVFHSKKSYRAHVVIHEGLSYPCPICGKLFQWKRNLARHTRNHRERENGSTYQCRECRKVFSSRDCYNNHMKLSKKHVHENSYAHICNFCGKKFPTKWCMVDHIDWDHLKRIKYQCSVCSKAFKTAKIMVAHMNNIHEGKNKKKEPDGQHLCDICGKYYKTVKRLKGHVWAMHTRRQNTKTHKCSLCPATFVWQTSIYKHMKMMHYSKRAKQPRFPESRVPVKKLEPYAEMETSRMQYFPMGGIPPPLVNVNTINVPNTL